MITKTSALHLMKASAEINLQILNELKEIRKMLEKMPCRITDEHVDNPWDRPDEDEDSQDVITTTDEEIDDES